MNAIRRFINERMGLRTAADVRNLVYVISPYLVSMLVAWNVTSEERAKLIVALAAAVFSPALAFTHTDDGFRKWVYGMLMPVQSLLVGFGVATESQIAPLASAVVAILGGALASSNTPVSRRGEVPYRPLYGDRADGPPLVVGCGNGR